MALDPRADVACRQLLHRHRRVTLSKIEPRRTSQESRALRFRVGPGPDGPGQKTRSQPSASQLVYPRYRIVASLLLFRDVPLRSRGAPGPWRGPFCSLAPSSLLLVRRPLAPSPPLALPRRGIRKRAPEASTAQRANLARSAASLAHREPPRPIPPSLLASPRLSRLVPSRDLGARASRVSLFGFRSNYLQRCSRAGEIGYYAVRRNSGVCCTYRSDNEYNKEKWRYK